MCAAAARRILLDMSDAQITIELELRLDGGCLTGVVTEPDGRRRPFSGWLGLIASIGELVDTALERGDTETLPAPDGVAGSTPRRTS